MTFSTGCTLAYEYKTVGVSLGFTPVVMTEGRISLRVSTEVAEVDPENGISSGSGANTITIPGFKVRKQDTTVELPSGGSLVSAGLIQQQMKYQTTGVPGLMNLPILGALFRSREYQKNETELLIIVTPYIAKTVQPSKIAKPADGFVDASDPQGALLGRFNKIYGPAKGRPVARQNNIGFINE